MRRHEGLNDKTQTLARADIIDEWLNEKAQTLAW